MSAIATAAGSVHPSRCRVVTRTEATSLVGEKSTTAETRSSGLCDTDTISVQVTSLGPCHPRAKTPVRDVFEKRSVSQRRSPLTAPSAVPVIGKAVGVP